MLQLVKAECFDQGWADNDEIDAFAAIDSSYVYCGCDPLHHEFAGGVITIPPRIVRKHEDYISRIPDDSIPPGIESDFDSEEDIIDNLLNDDPFPNMSV
ncbi:hypothetical protein Tco_1238907 [Tanacetum coccineum]